MCPHFTLKCFEMTSSSLLRSLFTNKRNGFSDDDLAIIKLFRVENGYGARMSDKAVVTIYS